MKFNVSNLLEKIVDAGASDLHLTVGGPPIVRINRTLSAIDGFSDLTLEDLQFFLSQVLTQEQQDLLELNREVDFSVALGDKARFRVNAFYQRGYPAVAMRTIPSKIPALDSLNLPTTLDALTEIRQGLVLVVGPTGHGKSTTLAAMIDKINQTRSEHIITVEDPIEYMFSNKKSVIAQREMYLDTHSWDVSLRSMLRQDPDVVLIGEMRDHETMKSALTIAETGHLVFATLHTNSAAQTIDRIVDSFPEIQQKTIRLQLSQVLEAVISIRLLHSKDGKLHPATELLLASDAARSLIREGKSHQLDNVISTSGHIGMYSLEQSLAELVNGEKIGLDEALRACNRPDILRRLVKGK